MNGFLVAQILLTISTVLITGAPLRADLHPSHATNPLWTPHARFHVVWQVLSYACLGIVNLYLIWFSPGIEDLVLSAAILGCIIIGFFLTAVNIKRFHGKFYDDNGYVPFARPKLFGKSIEMDVNATGFSIFALVLILSMISIYFAA